MGLIITERGFELFRTVTGNDPAAGDFLEGSAFRSLPLFKKILNSHQLQLVCILVEEALGLELTHETRGADLGNAGCQCQLGGIVNLQPGSAQEPRFDVLREKHLEHPLPQVRENGVRVQFWE